MYTPVGFKYLGASIMLNDSNSAQLINNKIFNLKQGDIFIILNYK